MRMRIVLVALLLAVAGAGPAGAQVAAPRLTPLFMGLNEVSSVFNPALDPVNPATQMWAGTSIVGAGFSTQGHYGVTDSNTGAEFQRGDLDTQVGQLRVVEDFAAFAATINHTQWEARTPPAQPNTKYDAHDLRFELALRFADWLALGVARQASHERVRVIPTPPTPPDEDVRRTELLLPGLSMRLGVLYLGYAAGSQEMRIEGAAVPPPGTLGATERDRRRVQRTGVGVFNRGDTWSYHVELYREEREGFKLPLSFPGFLIDETKLNGTTVELVVHDVLVGVEKSTTNNHEIVPGPPPAPVDFKSDLLRVSLGWVRPSGLAVVVTGQRGHRKDPATVGQISALLVSLGWSF